MPDQIKDLSNDVKAVITRQQIGDAMVQGIELFAD